MEDLQQPIFDAMVLKFMMAGFGVEAGTQSPTELPHAVMFRGDIAVRIIQHPDRVEVKVQFAFLESDDSDTAHVLN